MDETLLAVSPVPIQKRGHTYTQWMAALLANTTLLTYGLQAGWISPMTRVLQSDQSPTGSPLSDNEVSLIASTMCLSAIFSVFVYAYIADTCGRRVGVVTVAVPQALCWIIKLMFTSTPGLVIARIFCGLSAGGCFTIVPIYVKEISQDDMRGILGTLLIIMQNVGIMIMYVMGSYLNYYTVLRIAVCLPIANVILMLKAPESPGFLVKKGKIEKAASTVAFLRGLDINDKRVQEEIVSMKNENIYFNSLPNISFINIFKNKAWRRGFVMAMTIMTFAAFNGNFAILIYASAILSKSGVTVSPELQALSFPGVMLLSSLVSLMFVEKLGRRGLGAYYYIKCRYNMLAHCIMWLILATGFMVTAVSLVCLAMMLLLQRLSYAVPGWLQWLPVISMVLSLCAYAAGVSPIPYIFMSETFNFQIRAKLIGCVVTHAWFVSFIQLAVFGPLLDAVGPHLTFFGFAAVNLLGAFVALVFLPETKGKSVEQIESILKAE